MFWGILLNFFVEEMMFYDDLKFYKRFYNLSIDKKIKE